MDLKYSLLPSFKRKQNINNLFSFVNCCLLKINAIESIDELNMYMLSKDNSMFIMNDYENNQDIFSLKAEPDIVSLNSNAVEDIHSTSVNNKILYPKHKKSLFWCVFIAIHGYDEYLMIGNKFANRELEEQQRIMQYVKQNIHEMKSLKMKITNSLLQQIISELLVDNTNNMLLLNAFSIYYKSNIYVINQNNNTYIVFGNKDENYNSSSIIIHYYNKEKYGLNTHIQVNDINNYYFFLENLEKPLKSVSNYKLIDLKHSYIKLNNFNKNKYEYDINKHKKQELYDLISQLCIWK